MRSEKSFSYLSLTIKLFVISIIRAAVTLLISFLIALFTLDYPHQGGLDCMDNYAAIRSLSFDLLGPALGWDLSQFRRAGKDWVGPCYLHGSKNNKNCFRYHETGKFHCFSCEVKGSGSIDLTKLARNVNFTQAVEFLTPLASLPRPEQKSPVLGQSTGSSGQSEGELKPFVGKYHLHQAECEWLNQRVPDKAIRDRYGIFMYNNPARRSAYSGHVMLPVRDIDGTLYGYLGRNIQPDSQPKYIFPKGLPKSRFLFGSDVLKQHLLSLGTGKSVYQHVYLLESPLAVLKFASMGLPAVSCFGWSVSSEQIELVSQLAKSVVYLPDKNKRKEAANMLCNMATRLWVRFPELPENCSDPEQLDKAAILAL